MGDKFSFVTHVGGPLGPVTKVYRNGVEMEGVRDCQTIDGLQIPFRVVLGFDADEIETSVVHEDEAEPDGWP